MAWGGALPGVWSSCRAAAGRKAGRVDSHVGSGEVSECQAERSGVEFLGKMVSLSS